MVATRCPRLIHTWISRETAACLALAAGAAACEPGRRRGRSLCNRGAHRRVCAVGARGAELREVLAPALRYARRIAKVLLVEGVEKLAVAAVEGCWFKHAGKEPAEA